MHHNKTAFFCDEGHDNSPIVEIKEYKIDTWPFTINICGIEIHCEEQHLIAFKNSALSEYDRIRRERNGRE